MRNGPYVLVVAPAEYPGFRYRGRYVYEHHLVWWRHTGQLVEDGMILHHRDGNKHRNVPENLELQSRAEHMAEHKPQPSPGMVRCSAEQGVRCRNRVGHRGPHFWWNRHLEARRWE